MRIIEKCKIFIISILLFNILFLSFSVNAIVYSDIISESVYTEAFEILEVNGTESHMLDKIYTGYYSISADVFVADGVTSAKMTVASIDAAIDSENAGMWQTVKLNVLGDSFDEVVFEANGGTMYVKAINIEKIYKSIYSEDFEDKETGTDLITSGDYKRKYSSAVSDLHQFTVSENIGENTSKVGNLYKHGWWSAFVYDKDDPSLGEPPLGKDPEHIWINLDSANDAKKVIAKFDIYNQGDRRTSGNVITQLALTLGEQTSGTDSYWILKDNEAKLPLAQFGASKICLGAAGVTFDTSIIAPAKTWQKVIYEAERKQETDGSWTVTYSVTYGGKTSTNTITNAMANDFGRLSMGIYDRFGGRFYIDNINISAPVDDAADLENADTYAVSVYSVSAEVPNKSNSGSYIKINGDGRICFGQNSNTYSYNANVYENGELVSGASVVYSLLGEVPQNVSLNGNKIIVTGELPKDKHIVLRATLKNIPYLYAEKTITLQDQETYLADNARFNTLLEHIDNIYKYAGDDINDSSLISMIIDRNSPSPGFWVDGDKSEYIPSDLGSMGNFLRAVDSVGFLTGDKAYNEKVDSIYKAWMKDFSGKNGLPYWGSHTCADMLFYTKVEGTNSQHELKYNLPYMEPFFRLNPEYAENLCIQAWAEHITDWESMMFNRHGTYTGDKTQNTTEWNDNTKSYKLTEPSYSNINKSWDLSFSSAAIDLAQLATDLYKNTKAESAKNAVINIFDGMWKICGNDEDLLFNVPQNSTAGRFGKEDAAPYIQDISKIDENLITASSEYTGTGWGDRWWNAYGEGLIDQGYITEDQQWIVRECYSKFDGEQEKYYPFTQWDYINAVGPDTEEGKILLDRTIRAHANYIRMAYVPEENAFKKIFIDGTDITGFKQTRDFYGSTKGHVMGLGISSPELLLGTVYNYLNATNYPEYKEETDILWNYIRNHMDINGFGNLGTLEPGDNISLNFETTSAECDYMIAMLYLYQHTGIVDYLDMARLIADNITKTYMADGMFTSNPKGRYIFTGRGEGKYPYAFALLEATIRGEEEVVPLYHPCLGFREDSYYDEANDIEYNSRFIGYIYSDSEKYSDYDKSLEDFNAFSVNNEKKTITFADEYTGSSMVNATLYVVSGADAVLKAYDTENNEIGSTIIDTSKIGRRQEISINIVGESLKSISLSTDGLLYVKDIKIQKTYKGEIIFNEDFEDYEVGKPIDEYESYNILHKGEALYSTFTTSENIGGNNTKLGNLYNSSCYNGNAIRVNDDGNPADNITNTSHTYEGREYFSIPIDMNDTPNLRLEFKMYNAGNALHKTAKDNRDALSIGLVPSALKHCCSDDKTIVLASIRESDMSIDNNRQWGYNEETGIEQFNETNVSGTHGLKAKQWMDVVLEVRRFKKPINGTEQLCSEVSLTINGETIRSIIEGQDESDFGRLAFGVEYYHGGRIYLDDIKLYALTPLELDDDILSADVIKMQGESCTVAGLSGKDKLTAGELTYVTLRTSSETPRILNVLTALYNDEALENYSIDEVNTENFKLYEDTRVNLSTLITIPEKFENYHASVMIFDSLDTLIPLANKFDLKKAEISN